jgi:hypothetical protein
VTFLNSAALLALPLGALPILIHFLARERARVLPFSTVRFLRELEHSEIRRLRLREILLLVIRTLVVVGLVLLAARPAIAPKGVPARGMGSRAAVFVVLDDSYSMDLWMEEGSVYDRASKVVEEISATMGPADAGQVLFPRGPHFACRQLPLAAVDRRDSAAWKEVRPLPVGNDLEEPLRLARQWVQAHSTGRNEVYVVSDFVGSLSLPDSAASEIARLGRMFLVPVRRTRVANLSLLSVGLESQIVQPRLPLSIVARVANTGDVPVQERLVQLFWNGEPAAQSTLSLAPGEACQVVLRVVPRSSGWQRGVVVLEDDALDEDNRLWFAFEIPDRIRVLLIASSPEREILSYALCPPGLEVPVYEVIARGPGAVTPEDVRSAETLVLANVGELGERVADEIVERVREGGCLVVVPGPDVSPRELSLRLLERLGLPPVSGTFGRPGSVTPATFVSWMDRSHPLFAGVFEAEAPPVSLPIVYAGLRLASEVGLSVILRCADGLPFLCEKAAGQGKVFLFTTGLDPEWSDLARKGIFVALLQRIPVYARQRADGGRLFQLVGEPIEVVDGRLPLGGVHEVERPDGTRVRLVPEASAGGTRVVYGETDLPGIYTMLVDGRPYRLVAVNPDPKEADLRPVDVAALASSVGATVLGPGPELRRNIALFRRGKELWPWLAGTVLALLFAELVISKTVPEKEVKQRGTLGV